MQMTSLPAKAELDALVSAVMAFPISTPLTGWLECDGSAISRTTYADLYAVIGTMHGVGDGSTTFNLPDFRGQFLRGWDHGAGVDLDAASRLNRGDGTTGDNVGTKQGCQIQSHDHDVTCTDDGGGPKDKVQAGVTSTNYTLSTEVFGGNETRPTNVNVMWCIIY
jgi:microcystin-dependent protein